MSKKKYHQKLIDAQKLINKGNYQVALDLLNQLLQSDPRNIDCLMLRAETHLRLELFNEALQEYASIVQIAPTNVTALNNFSLALIRNSKYAEAKDILNYLIEIDSSNFGAYINFCSVYQAVGDYENAINASLKAIEIDPKSALAFLNLGTSLASLERLEDANQAYMLATTLDPKNVLIKINLAQLAERLEDRKTAIKLYEEILQSNITDLQQQLIKFYLSFSYLYFGDLSRGWDYYEYGFGALLPYSSLRSTRKFHQPLWTGEIKTQKKILIWREQGLGDEVVFATCLPDLYKLNLNIVLECEARLLRAYERSFPKWEVRSESQNSEGYPLINDFDLHLPMGSLPKIFRGSIEKFFKDDAPLFKADNFLKGKYEKLLAAHNNKIKIGISWRGGLLNLTRNENYTGLKDWKSLLTNSDYTFVNLQYGECEDEITEVETELSIKIIRWADLDLKNDLESLLALCSNLDYVVSVGTAVSMLAPSVGVHTILLTKRSWLFLGSANKFPWFEKVTTLIAEKNEMVASKITDIPFLIGKK